MYRIGIVGHTPEYIPNPDTVKTKINHVMDLIRYQYGEDLVFNIAGDIGVSEWAANTCIERKYRYHFFLPYPVEDMENLWYPEQLQAVENHFRTAWATTISFPRYVHGASLELQNYQHLVDASAFVICFWKGMKAGITADTIRYALSQHKLVVNGLDDLKLITAKDTGHIDGRDNS